jgi:hypothetical protein
MDPFILWISRTLGTQRRTLRTQRRTLGTEARTLGTDELSIMLIYKNILNEFFSKTLNTLKTLKTLPRCG